MEKREIIGQTIRNMGLIYNDVGQVGQIIEEKIKNWGFKALGDSQFTWDNSSSINNSRYWLFKWFARVYLSEKDTKKMIGFCIHLGGYQPDWIEKLESFSISLPVMNVSLLKLDQDVNPQLRTSIYNCLWSAGWADDFTLQNVSQSRVVYGEIDGGGIKPRSVTYFLPLLSLTNGEIIERLVVEPMVRMFNGKEEWVIKAGLQVVQISEGQ